MTMINVQVPFQGFYETFHDSAIDDELASDFGHYEEQGDQEGIKLVENFSMTNKKMVSYAKNYLIYLSGKIESELGIKFNFSNHVVKSPREYNFINDKIFAEMESDVLDRIYRSVMENHVHELTQMIHDELEPASGFIPFYSNDFSTWDADIKNWDSVQIEFVLRCYLNAIDEEWEQDVINDMKANGYVSEAIHS